MAAEPTRKALLDSPVVLRRLLRAAGVTAYAILVLVVFALSGYVAFNQWVRRGVTTVPELAGLSEEEAARLLADIGLAFRRAETERWSDKVEAGRIIESRPRAGSLVKRGAAIEAFVSLGARRVVVPELAGKAMPAAQIMLRGESLEPGATLSVLSGSGTPGTIVAQDPPAGASVAAGTAVDLLVATESAGATYVMPDLVYRRYEPIRRAFESGGFRFGNVSFEPYEGVAEGTILRQDPLPGHPLRRSEPISLVVASTRAPAEPQGVGGGRP
jgi:eukaryotic-like serine/threonine-protein kinase